MKSIVTLTMNPTIDAGFEVQRLHETHKMRTLSERYAPGGGGINVARVFVRLGGNARCCYLSGGATGHALDGLLDELEVLRTRIPIARNTRIAVNTLERETGKEFRIVPAGPAVSEAEWQACIDAVVTLPGDILVASGSLPPGVPSDFFARLAASAKASGVPLVLDTSGEALRQGLDHGGIWLVKPSLGELSNAVGRELESVEDIAAAGMEIVASGQSEMVAVTLGGRGALLARQEGTSFLPALNIQAKSAVGAGDSFLAAMLFKLAGGSNAEEAFRYGMAGGAAAVLDPGTDLAHPDDIERLFPQVGKS